MNKNRKKLWICAIMCFIVLIITWVSLKILSPQVAKNVFIFIYFPLAICYGIINIFLTPKYEIDNKIMYIFMVGIIGHFAFASMSEFPFIKNNIVLYKTIAIMWLFCFAFLSLGLGIYYKNRQLEYSKVYKPKIRFTRAGSSYNTWIKSYYFACVIFLIFSIGYFLH